MLLNDFSFDPPPLFFSSSKSIEKPITEVAPQRYGPKFALLDPDHLELVQAIP